MHDLPDALGFGTRLWDLGLDAQESRLRCWLSCSLKQRGLGGGLLCLLLD